MVTFLIGTGVGIAFTFELVFTLFNVETKESWEEDRQRRSAMRKCITELAAENARLRLSLASGELTEDGKKVATVAMAALAAVGGEEKVE